MKGLFPNRRPKSASDHTSSHHHLSGYHGNHHHHSEAERLPVNHVTEHSKRKSRSRDRSPPRAVVVDTGKPNRSEKIHRELKDRHVHLQRESDVRALQQSDHDHRKGILRKSAATQSTPRLTDQIESSAAQENHKKSDESEKVSSSAAISSEEGKNSWKMSDHQREKTDPKKIAVDRNIQKEKSYNSSSKAVDQRVRLILSVTLSTVRPVYCHFEMSFGSLLLLLSFIAAEFSLPFNRGIKF